MAYLYGDDMVAVQVFFATSMALMILWVFTCACGVPVAACCVGTKHVLRDVFKSRCVNITCLLGTVVFGVAFMHTLQEVLRSRPNFSAACNATLLGTGEACINATNATRFWYSPEGLWQIHEDDLFLAYALCSVSTLLLAFAYYLMYLGNVITQKLGKGAADLKKREYWDQDTEAVAMGDLEMQPLQPDLRAELESMRVGALRSRAQHDGIDAEKIEHALDADDIKDSLVELILEKASTLEATSGGEETAQFSRPHANHGIVKTADEEPIGAIKGGFGFCIAGLRVVASVPERYHPEGGGCIVSLSPHSASSSATSHTPFPDRGFNDMRPNQLARYLAPSQFSHAVRQINSAIRAKGDGDMIALLCCACTCCTSFCIHEAAFTAPWLKRIEATLDRVNGELPDGIWFGCGSQKVCAKIGSEGRDIHPLLLFVGRDASLLSDSDAPTNETMERTIPRPTYGTVGEAESWANNWWQGYQEAFNAKLAQPADVYLKAEALFDLLRPRGTNGRRKVAPDASASLPVRLIRGSWMLERAKHVLSATTDEERRKRALPRRQIIEETHPRAFLSADEVRSMRRGHTGRGVETCDNCESCSLWPGVDQPMKVVAISHGWLTPQHPDPFGQQLINFARQVEQERAVDLKSCDSCFNNVCCCGAPNGCCFGVPFAGQQCCQTMDQFPNDEFAVFYECAALLPLPCVSHSAPCVLDAHLTLVRNRSQLLFARPEG